MSYHLRLSPLKSTNILYLAKLEKGIEDAFEKVELRDAFRKIFALSSLGNKKFQDAEPWKKVKENPDAVKGLLWNLLYLIRDLAILIRPYMPETSNKISNMLGIEISSWEKLLELSGITKVEKPSLLFKKLEDKDVESFRDRFSGSQKERAENTLSYFRNHVDLRAAKIIKIEKHPKADKLYIEKVDFGNEVRQIVSGLVPYYKEEELLNRTVIVVANLKSVKLRGVESNGMLLAADDKENVEVLFADSVEPGSRVILEGDSVNDYKDSPDLIDIDSFFSVPINIADHNAKIENKRLVCGDIPLTTGKVERGAVR